MLKRHAVGKGSVIIAVIFLSAAALLCWQFLFRKPPEEGIVYGNGRLEAEQVNISTKYAGRVSEILVDEGDTVKRGQTLALMDVKLLETELKEARAMELKAVKQKKNATALLEQRESECNLALRNLNRATKLFQKGIISQENMDEASTNAETARARCQAAEAGVEDARASIEAAKARIETLKVKVDESRLVSPVTGRVQYRLAEPLEVLPAGGKVLTVIDTTDVFMNVYLSTRDSGSVGIGADARIVLDAFPDEPLPARVTFVAPEAQFTPKEVETTDERQKLSFRVKVSLRNGDNKYLKPGMPGVAYILTDDSAVWPESLR